VVAVQAPGSYDNSSMWIRVARDSLYHYATVDIPARPRQRRHTTGRRRRIGCRPTVPRRRSPGKPRLGSRTGRLPRNSRSRLSAGREPGWATGARWSTPPRT